MGLSSVLSTCLYVSILFNIERLPQLVEALGPNQRAVGSIPTVAPFLRLHPLHSSTLLFTPLSAQK